MCCNLLHSFQILDTSQGEKEEKNHPSLESFLLKFLQEYILNIMQIKFSVSSSKTNKFRFLAWHELPTLSRLTASPHLLFHISHPLTLESRPAYRQSRCGGLTSDKRDHLAAIVRHDLATRHSVIRLFFLNSDGCTSLWSLPDVAGDLDSQTIEVLASWMLEHPLTEEQQAAESARPEGAPDTPSPDGPETVQCPERPTSQPTERSGI